MQISALSHPPLWLALDSRQLADIESPLLQLARLLNDRGVLVEVIMIAHHIDTPPLARALQQAGIRCHLAADSLDFFQLLHRQRPCLLHCHGSRASLLGGLLGRWLRIPVLMTRHGLEPGLGLRLLMRLTSGFSLELPQTQLPSGAEQLPHLLHVYQHCLGETLLPQAMESQPPFPSKPG